MAQLLTRDEVQSIVKEMKTKVVLQPTAIDNLYNDLNVALLGMGFYTKLEGVTPEQAEQALREFKRGLAKLNSQRNIIEPLLTSLLFRQVLKLGLPPSTCSGDCIEGVEDFFRAVDVLTKLTKTGLNEVKCVLPTHARPDQLILTDLPRIYRAYFKAECGSGDGPGARFIMEVLNKAGIKNKIKKEFTLAGVVKYRDRAAKPSRKRNAKV
jgi:hypothetical protein